MNKKTLAISIATGLLGMALSAQASQDCAAAKNCSVKILDEILITGTRTEKPLMYSPNAMALINEEQMKWSVTGSLAEVLRDVPGLEVTDAGQAGMKRVRIRGEQSYRVAVLVDGQEITDHRGEGVPLTLNPALVERVEVIRGAGSVLYGPKALGGVINFITRKGGDKPLQLTASTGWDSATEGEQYFVSGYGSQSGFDYRVSYTKDQHNDRQTPAGEIENTESASDSKSLYLGKHWDKHSVALSWEDHNAFSEVFVEDEVRFAFPFNEFAMEIPQRDREKVAFFYDWENSGEYLERLHLDAYRQTSDRQFNTYWSQVIGMEKETFSQSELVTDGALAQIDFKPADNHYVIAGLQYTKDDIKQDRQEFLYFTSPFPLTVPSQISDQASLRTDALFIQDEWQVNEQLAVTTGVRQYWVDSELELSTRDGLITPPKDDNELIMSIAATWEIGEGSVIRTSYSEGYMYPSLLQLAIGGVARTFVNPDPSLEPEKSDSFELGWRYSNDSVQVDVTAFVTDAENYIDHIPCVASPSCIGGSRRTPAEIYVNIGEATTKGLESSLEYRWSDSLSSYASMSLLRRENRFETFSTRDAGLPSVSGVTGLKYRDSLEGIGAYWVDVYARGESSADETEVNGVTHHNDGWVTANMTAGVEFGEKGNYRLVLELHNLLDKQYSSAAENLWAPERSVLARLVADF